MRAYALRNHEAELIWSWEPEPQRPVAAPEEFSCNSLPGESASPVKTLAFESVAENPNVTTQTALSALESAIRVRQESEHQDANRLVDVEPDSTQTSTLESRVETLAQWVQAAHAGTGVALRQQVERIQELKEQSSRTEKQSESSVAQTRALHSRLDILDERIQTILERMDSLVRDQADMEKMLAARREEQVGSKSTQLCELESHAKGPGRVPPASVHRHFEEPTQAISQLRALAAGWWTHTQRE